MRLHIRLFSNPLFGKILAIGILTCVFTLVAYVFGLTTFGSLGATQAWLRGDDLYVFQQAIDLPKNVESGHQFVCHVQNVSGHSINMIGSKTSCGCLTFRTVPERLEANAVTKIDLVVLDKEKLLLNQGAEFVLFTDSQRKPVVRVQVFAGS